MSSAPASHRKTRKIRRTGRHAARVRSRRAVKIIGLAVPAVAVIGTFAAYQLQPQHPDPVARSVASYHIKALVSGTAKTDADGASRLPAPSSGTSKSAATGAAHSGSQPAASPAPAANPTAATTALTCNGAGGTGMLPYNYATIVNFLVAHGYTRLAAAGIAGNIYQESKGDPESIGSGGGGLIGWTPLPSGFVTGNPAADLQTQLTALLSYNQGWAQYIPMLNAATNPTDAAYVYMTYFERPGIPAAANREGAAVAVAQACGIA
jgi:Phage tail lysozyme